MDDILEKLLSYSVQFISVFEQATDEQVLFFVESRQELVNALQSKTESKPLNDQQKQMIKQILAADQVLNEKMSQRAKFAKDQLKKIKRGKSVSNGYSQDSMQDAVFF